MADNKIPQEIKNKIVGEANWRSTNGHGGVDDITRDNFIIAAEYGYSLSAPSEQISEEDEYKMFDTMRQNIINSESNLVKVPYAEPVSKPKTFVGPREKLLQEVTVAFIVRENTAKPVERIISDLVDKIMTL